MEKSAIHGTIGLIQVRAAVNNERRTGRNGRQRDSRDEEKYETINDSEDKQQTLRLCRETEDVTIGMMKMNIKLPTPTQYDGKSPCFNEWAGEVKSYLTVHNIYIEDLMEDSTRSQVPT
eukprot:4569841-Amphidinium_carterae.1